MQIIKIETSKAIYSVLNLARESPPSLAFGRDTGRGRVGRRKGRMRWRVGREAAGVADQCPWPGESGDSLATGRTCYVIA